MDAPATGAGKPVVRDDVKIDPTQLIPPKPGYYTFPAR